jgi:hypothetical protein
MVAVRSDLPRPGFAPELFTEKTTELYGWISIFQPVTSLCPESDRVPIFT